MTSLPVLPVCRWRGGPVASEPANPRFSCHSPSVILRDGAVGAATCAACLLADHEPRPGTRRRKDEPPKGRTLALRTAPPECVHRGKVLGQLECHSCGTSKPKIDVYECRAGRTRGRCTTDPLRHVYAVERCHTCDEPNKPPPRELIPGLIDPIPEPAMERTPAGWHKRPEVRDRHIAAIRHLATCDIPGPGPRSGDGIVTAGGGQYWPMLTLSVRMIRERGCTLPVQVWHRGGQGETVRPEDVAGMGVELIDIDARLPNRRARRGWETKTAALIHCGFRRAMFLDADAYPLVNLADLFAMLDRSPFVFWEDHGRNLKAPWYGFTREAAEAVPPVQGGHYLADCVAWWRQLVLAYWLDQHGDYFYSRGSAETRDQFHSWGDQDQLAASLIATGSQYLCVGKAVRHAAGCVPEVGGRPVIVHRYAAKLIPGRAPVWHDDLPAEAEVRKAWAELNTKPREKPAMSNRPYAHSMTDEQYARVESEIAARAPCRALIFGAGHDTERYVRSNPGGRTVVIEDQEEWAAVARKAGAEVHVVRYDTLASDGLQPDVLPLKVAASVTAERFDVVLIDAPLGGTPDSPGRQQPSALAARLVAEGGVIFAHDAQHGGAPRGYASDSLCYAHHLGLPVETVKGPPDLAVFRAAVAKGGGGKGGRD